MAGGFHPLRVADVERLTDDSVAVTFEVPEALRDAYRYTAGQHIAVRMPGRADAGDGSGEGGNSEGGSGEGGNSAEGSSGGGSGSAGGGDRSADGAGEIRRTYSICSPAPAPGAQGPAMLRVGVRMVEGGEFSTFANKELAVDHVLDVMTPAGRFTLPTKPGHYAAVVGGSGITPVLSLVATFLEQEPDTRFCLVRCDRTAASAMFLDEVADLKDRFPERLQLVHVLTREERQAGLPSGRLDADRLAGLLPSLLPVDEVAGWFLCGPYQLIEESADALRRLGVDRARVHQEVFHVDDRAPAVRVEAPTTGGTVTAVLDGRSGTWPNQGGEAVLDTVLRNRSDAPYACKGGVCGTCRAFLVSGSVRMDRNFALEPDEVEAGYVLACQSHPTSESVEVDFDR
ncbi:2Fe-2S iron-sulfur cluster-binding protein [Wenjunlia tyrosinilytica]|uniref:Phenylacetic acid degradation protein PaaE/phenylacetate-CoA oxygenase/reductase, PaaK subunit n=1 Tax=Wenjunlia tyrosinilytica TaxID=1544741 RepID=A0A917ZN44_9ACTN|nr:2Fe-2S iron-sulfur cluster-binding protein [Wenjunlia tyrosinilytica]GGO86081.1 putative phenylacetic acid degradation protein PaaE/phenylacetate-CoA oxygenase/reductase, PaaK subunit [Wenjunlia tyrosinilytica]